MSVQEWVTELAKAENDALRTSGDVKAIVAKYEVPQPATLDWFNIPQSIFQQKVGEDWLLGLSAADRTKYLDDWSTVNGDVRLNNDTLRAELFLLLSAQQQTDVQGAATTQQALWETIPISSRPTENRIANALRKSPDSPQYDDKIRRELIKDINKRVRNGKLDITSTANLQTIDSVLGV